MFSNSNDSSGSSSNENNNDDKMIMTPVSMDSPSAQRNKGPIWDVLHNNVFLDMVKKEQEQQEGVRTAASAAEAKTSNVVHTIRVLEIAAGCGVHMEHFCSQLQALLSTPSFYSKDNDVVIKKKNNKLRIEWYPTDPDEASRKAIQERIDSFVPLSLFGQENESKHKSKANNSPKEEEEEEQQHCQNNNQVVKMHPPQDLRLEKDGPTSATASAAAAVNGLDLIVCINMIHISPWDATLGLMKLAQEKLVPGGILFCYGPYKVGGTAVASNLAFDQSLRSRNAAWGVRDLEEVTKVAKANGLTLRRTLEMPANNLSVFFQKD